MIDEHGQSAPLTIAHRAANDLSSLMRAYAAGAEFAEADVWFHRGRLEVRHDRTAGPLPVLWGRWFVRFALRRPLVVGDLLAVTGAGKLFLDLKGRAPGMAPALADGIRRSGRQGRVAVSGNWPHLDELGRLLPDVPRFYSVGSLRRLELLRPRLMQREIERMSIDSQILSQPLVRELADSGVQAIVSWHVETIERARELLSWGVRGITSGNLGLLSALRDGAGASPDA